MDRVDLGQFTKMINVRVNLATLAELKLISGGGRDVSGIIRRLIHEEVVRLGLVADTVEPEISPETGSPEG